MQFKPTKGKVLVSLIPFYFLVFTVPVLFDWYGNYFGRIVNFFESLGVLFYIIFTILLFPFIWFFEKFGLYDERGGFFSSPEISLFGLILLALIYSSLIYFLISFFQKKN